MDKKDAKQIIDKVVKRFPNLKNVANVKILFDERKVDAAATNGKTLFLNSKYMDNLNEEEKVTIFAFCLTQASLKHNERMKGKDIELWQLASNAVIVELLKKDGLKFPKECITFDEAKDKTIDEVYEMLTGLNKSIGEIGKEVIENHSIAGLMVEEDERDR